MEREDALNPDPVGNLAYSERRPVTAVGAANDRPFEDLDALFIPFDDLRVHTDGVADFKVGDVGL